MPQAVRSRNRWTPLKNGARIAISLATAMMSSTLLAAPESHPGLPSDRQMSGRRTTGTNALLNHVIAMASTGRTQEAEQLCRSILRDNPEDANAYRELLKISASHDLPVDSLASWSAQQHLGNRFIPFQTPRFVLFSDVAETLTNQNATWVERTHEEFARFARECGLNPLPLQHKLVCVLFDNRQDYLNFAQAEDGLNNIAFTGYYSPRHDRVVFSVDSQKATTPATTALEHAIDQNPAAPVSKPVLGFDAHDSQTSAESRKTLLRSTVNHDVPNESAAKCVHETIHQLMFHTGVMAPDVQYPLWICEGLSTAFETDSPSQPFGPDLNYAPRRNAFESLLRNGELIPLRTLVTITELLPGKNYTTLAVYQQSYALVGWLYRNHREQLRDYLNLMRMQPPGRISPSQHLHLFESVFGNADQLQQDWLQDEWRSLDRQTADR